MKNIKLEAVLSDTSASVTFEGSNHQLIALVAAITNTTKKSLDSLGRHILKSIIIEVLESSDKEADEGVKDLIQTANEISQEHEERGKGTCKQN